MAEITFDRTCNYWIDAGIVGLYDTLNKPVPDNSGVGVWGKTIKGESSINPSLSQDKLVIEGEEDKIDLALSYALERVRTALYDVSTEKQIASPEKDKRIKQMSTVGGEIIASGKQADYTYFRQEIIKKVGRESIFFPLKQKQAKKVSNCVYCGHSTKTVLTFKKANEVFTGQALKSSPFVEGDSSNRCFHSYHNGSVKCWQCGYTTFFAPLLLFYRRNIIDRSKKDTYYILPYVPGNLGATYKLYRSLSGKRGLARAAGTEHTIINYESHFKESHFKSIPKGMPVFTLSFYYDLCERLLPKTGMKLLKASEEVGLIDDRGAIFQTALFLKRDSGQKSFILREITIDRSVYFIKLFTYLKKHLDKKGHGKLLSGLHSLIMRGEGKGNHLQRLSVIRASQALSEGKHVYRFLLPLLSSDINEKTARPYDAGQLTILFQKYDQWLFKKEDEIMSNIVEQAKNSGWHLSMAFWEKPDWDNWDNEEKKNLIKRYYYNVERSPSPVKFLEQVRHAYKKVEKGIPKEMVFHKEDGSDDIQRFEVYRVYFLAGMLNGLISQHSTESKDNNEKEGSNNE